jgi:aryl-alcohol dehydrogenase
MDLKPSRLALARELGATHVIDNRKTISHAKRIAAITGGGVNYVLESTGDAELYRLALDLLNPDGRLALMTGESRPNDLPDGRKVLSIEGDAVPQLFIPHLIELYRDGRCPFDRLMKFYEFDARSSPVANEIGDFPRESIWYGLESNL